MRTPLDWMTILLACQVKPDVAATWANAFAATITETTFSAGDQDLAPFLAQMLFETAGLTQLEEDLNYTALRITQVWPSRFPTLASAQPYAGVPRALANKVYGGRMGNHMPDDGWDYRGRGMPQITGLDNYVSTGKLIGQDLAETPDLLLQPSIALVAGIAWWERHIPDSALTDTVAVTRIVNGGTTGLAQRQKLTVQALAIVGATA